MGNIVNDSGSRMDLSLEIYASQAGDKTRRQVLKSLVLAGAGAILPAGGLLAQFPSTVTAAKPYRIDVHHHIFPKGYVKREKERILAITDMDFSTLLNWTPANAIEEMNRYGIATAITSVSNPGVWFGDPQEARSLARECNDYGAQLVKDYPGRFGMFAALPLPDREGSLREIEYAIDFLKADGFALLTSYGDRWPGDASYAPVFEELNRRKAVIFIHPTTPGCCGNLIPGVPPSLTEFLFDTTRAITSLLVNGVFARFPDIRYIFSHAGGTMPVLASRINAFFARHKELAAQAPNGVPYELKRLYYDVANSTNPSSMSALMNLVPTSQMLFGSDFPFVPVAVTANGIDNFKLSLGDAQAVNRENAIGLFPRLKRSM